jgi:hypothetical protein
MRRSARRGSAGPLEPICLVSEADATWSRWADEWPAPTAPDRHETQPATGPDDDLLSELWRDPVWGERAAAGAEIPGPFPNRAEAFHLAVGADAPATGGAPTLEVGVGGAAFGLAVGAPAVGVASSTLPVSRFAAPGLHDDLLPQHGRRRARR